MTLHIHAQDCWHFPACIVGTQESLTRLQALIERAMPTASYLNASKQLSEEFTTSDGEGYSLTVICSDSEEFWNQASLPYTDEIAHRDNGTHPLVLLQQLGENNVTLNAHQDNSEESNCPTTSPHSND